MLLRRRRSGQHFEPDCASRLVKHEPGASETGAMELPASRSGDSVWFRRTRGGVFSVFL
ncbi:MAG: hypothetical protein AAGI14_00720 [Pseudomonadota bacterium]